MIAAPTPSDEPDRLAALRRYAVLDTPAEADFDDLTMLASSICETPISLISLLDGGRQWFKSRVGLDVTETARTISFCGHAIVDQALFEVPNASDDPRFFDNPLVLGDPNIRFYAGAPLTTSDGYRLGTLCVIDRIPRNLSEHQRVALEALSRQVVRQLESRAMASALCQQSLDMAFSEKRLRTITDNLPVAISYVDQQERYRFVNATMHAWTNTRSDEVIGRTLLEVVGEELYSKRRAYYRRALAGERVEFFKDAYPFHQHRHLQATFIPDIGDDGKVRGIFTLSHDVTALKKTEEDLRRMARFDSLTGLPNRAHLYELLPAALERSQRNAAATAVLFLDIDRFKSINDTLGHAKGDLVLQEFAHRLQHAVRVGDTVARLAGDEFIVVLECLKGVEAAAQVAQKIIVQMSRPWILNGERLAVTTSIGIAYDTSHALTGPELISRADEALYAAKSAGRNTFRITAGSTEGPAQDQPRDLS